jgi:hypothetical protein
MRSIPGATWDRADLPVLDKQWIQEAETNTGSVPVHGFETPICAYAALASGPIWSARTWAGVL